MSRLFENSAEELAHLSSDHDLLLPQLDATPWAHPFLTEDHLRKFRQYSEWVWSHVSRRAVSHSPLNCGFAVNMAQNMYKWAKLAAKFGACPTLYLNPQDSTAISKPAWEEFDGEWPDVLDGNGFAAAFPDLPVRVPVVLAPNEGSELWSAYHPSRDAAAIDALRRRSPSVRHEPMLALQGTYPYFRWAELLATHDVNYIASTPFPAFVSGKPYCVFSVGGDLQYDCGRNDDYGRAMRLAFARARFILASNPHTLGHCRRFGFRNALYLPYPMDTDTYCPGEGHARSRWAERFGGDVFVLTTARIDGAVKGHSDGFFQALQQVAKAKPNVRFVFLAWGAQMQALEQRIADQGLRSQFVLLPPVGKQKLLDYYRSSDIVLDQFVYGYYGATALEAASTGKPVIMKLQAQQYRALYDGDLAPVVQADDSVDIARELSLLIDSVDARQRIGRDLRDWVVRTHGEQRTVPLLLALLQFTARGMRLPRGGPRNPLSLLLSDKERAYHRLAHERALAA